MATKTTTTGKAIEGYIQNTLDRSQKGADAAQSAGYPSQSPLTQQYYSGVRNLGNYGNEEQAQALARMGDLYNAYQRAGDYDKTNYQDLEGWYRGATKYDPTKYEMARYTAKNIKDRMNPYEQLVAKQQKKRLQQAFGENRGNREAEAIRNQAFGGSGSAIREAMADRDYMNQLADLNATSLSNAFDSGANLYGREIADRMAAMQNTEASRQFAQQNKLSGIEGIMSARNQTAAQYAAAKEAQMAALQGQGVTAQQQAAMAEQQKQMYLADLAAQQAAGSQQEDYALNKAQYPLTLATMQGNTLGALQGSTSDIPVSKSSTSTLQNILGGLSSAAGVASTLKDLFASGGLVGHRYADGGIVDLYSYYYPEG